jgi:uncharacterized protein
MLARAVLRAVDFAIRRAWFVVVISISLTLASIVYAATHFALNTDIDTLISPDLSWRKTETAFAAAFPRFDLLLVVVSAPTSELAEQANSAL